MRANQLTCLATPQAPELFDNAILRDDLPMIKLLLKYSAVPSSQTLQTVLKARRDDILLLLLHAGLSPNQKWSAAKPNVKVIGSVGWWTPLHQAVKDGCVPIIELLLEHHADVDAYVYLEQVTAVVGSGE